MEKTRRTVLALILVFVGLGWSVWQSFAEPPAVEIKNSTPVTEVSGSESTKNASEILNALSVKGRAPRTGYSRAQFGGGWPQFGLCDLRNQILRRDMTNVQTVSADDCTVVSGALEDPYTGQTIMFQRGVTTSRAVEIDHIVALSDAWQKGAQNLTEAERTAFANDPLNLLAVSGPANTQKSDSDAASWLPSNKSYRCRFVARQIAVKAKHKLWVTEAEKDIMAGILNQCPGQLLPISGM